MKRNYYPIWLLCLAAFFGFCGNLHSQFAAEQTLPSVAETNSQSPSDSTNDLQNLIQILEDEQAREALIQQLESLAEARSETTKDATSEISLLASLTETVSRKMASIGHSFDLFLGNLKQVTAFVPWVNEQFRDPERRSMWMDVLMRLTAVIGIGYLAFYLARWLLRPVFRSVSKRHPTNLWTRLSWLILDLIAEAIPIVIFGVVAYACLPFFSLREETRLVALTWIHASILVRVLLLVVRFFVSPVHSHLRLFDLSDESAHYLNIWIRRIALTSIYGYLILQTARLLGLAEISYQGALRILGIVVAALLIAFIFQNRKTVAKYIRGDLGKGSARLLRARLAGLWHWAAILYVILLYGIWALSVEDGFSYMARNTGLSVVVIAAGAFVTKIVDLIWTRGIRISLELHQQFPHLQERVNRYLPVVRKSLKTFLVVLQGLLVLQVWGLDLFQWFASPAGTVFLKSLLHILLIVVITFFLWEGTSLWIEKYLSEQGPHGELRIRSARARTLLTVAKKALIVALFIISSLLVLSEIGINIAPLLATAGVLGLAIGFGSQKLVQDVITGVFILLEDLFSVGDVIKVGDTAGLVEAVSIRNVRLRDFSGVVHTIPFSGISTISNLTKEFSFYVFDIGVAYRENVDEVMKVMKQVGEEIQADPEIGPMILEPLDVVGVDTFADSAVVIKARIKTLPIKQWSVGRAYNRRLKIKFDELGIEIPFPHQTVYFGENKDGSAPPMRVEMDSDLKAEKESNQS